MAGDRRRFLRLAEDLAKSFVRQRVRIVVTDSWQLYNPVHDLWHLTVCAAVASASNQLGWAIECLDFEVVPAGMSARAAGEVIWRNDLTPAQLDSKLELIEEFPEIAEDVVEILRMGGEDFLKSEEIHRVRSMADLVPRPGEKPLYERHGELRVADGLYGSVLRWEHVEWIALALVPTWSGTSACA